LPARLQPAALPSRAAAERRDAAADMRLVTPAASLMMIFFHIFTAS